MSGEDASTDASFLEGHFVDDDKTRPGCPGATFGSTVRHVLRDGPYTENGRGMAG